MSQGTRERESADVGGGGSGISKSCQVDQLREELSGRGTNLHKVSET